MKNLFTKNGWLVIAALSVVLSLSARADIVFDNSTTDLGIRFNPGTAEVGNQIFLSDGGYITNFSFEYYGIGGGIGGSFNGAYVQARVRWYLNDSSTLFNGFKTPGTALFDSLWTDIIPTSAATLRFSAPVDFGEPWTPGLFVPSVQLTWTVQFRGMGAGDEVGLELFGPPTVGKEYTDYWMRQGSTWQLMADTNGVPITFGQQWMAAVPEPSTLALSLVGGVGLFLAVRRFRK